MVDRQELRRRRTLREADDVGAVETERVEQAGGIPDQIAQGVGRRARLEAGRLAVVAAPLGLQAGAWVFGAGADSLVEM